MIINQIQKTKQTFVVFLNFINFKFFFYSSLSLVFLSNSLDVNQVKRIDAKKLLNNDKDYVKELRDHFRLKLLEIIK